MYTPFLQFLRNLLNKINFLIFWLILIFLFSSIFVLPASSIPFISKKREVEIGHTADKQIVLQFGIYQDKALRFCEAKLLM